MLVDLNQKTLEVNISKDNPELNRSESQSFDARPIVKDIAAGE